MLKGTIKFRAKIRGDGVTFPPVEFKPNKPEVEKAEVDSPTGDEILGTVHLPSVATRDEGRAVGSEVITSTLNRISFNHAIAIENPEITNEDFSPLKSQPGVLVAGPGHYAITGHGAGLVHGVTATCIKGELEQVSPKGVEYFSLFRSARQSTSAVEEFVTLYKLLLMLFNDSQTGVDDFIRHVKPDVPQTQHPLKGPGVMETTYTRLRNELAHHRQGVNLEVTKAEMARRLGDLVTLTKHSIESRS